MVFCVRIRERVGQDKAVEVFNIGTFSIVSGRALYPFIGMEEDEPWSTIDLDFPMNPLGTGVLCHSSFQWLKCATIKPGLSFTGDDALVLNCTDRLVL